MSKLLAGRYELIEKIGEGGMAVVYKAKDRLLNRYVAIKILRPEFTQDEQFLDSFKRESQAAAGLQHPNIVSIYDVGRTGNINFIVMELVDGRPLSDFIKENGHLDYKTTIDIAKQVASALAIAHKHQIIHRDVKPHNIMITSDGVAKLTDFGIARAVSKATMVADTSKIIGSVHYFSPEQARGAYVDERSDIYSLGIVMFEMLTGRVPFDGETPVEVALKHINEDVPSPAKLVPGIPPALDKVVLKATDKYQTERYKSADEMLEALKNVEFVTQMVGDRVFAGETDNKPRRDENLVAPVMSSRREDREQEMVIAPANPRKPKAKSDDKKKKKRAIIIGVAAAVILALFGILYVSGIIGGGGKEVTVPDVKGMSYSEAKEVLEAKGLKIEKADEPIASQKIEKGKIVSQTPSKNSKVKKGRTVRVILSAGNTELKVPDLKGLSYKEAKTLLSEMGLQISKGDEVDSDSVAEGLIASQYPSAKTKVDKGDIITVNISKGKKDAVIPKLVGTTFTSESDVSDILSKYGYKLGKVSYEESYETPGTIIKQSPDAGTTAEKKTSVDIVISKAKSKATVPNLNGMTYDQAESALQSLGFSVGRVTEEENNGFTAGTVFKQYPAANSEYQTGSTVDIWIAKSGE
ncbi:MAG: Stk1 family PASTA domain-containing Ser/Thr kinase [[Eubacterium] sulci]|jgi:serine/threonine-protein kinase prkC|nr:putative serine/threonine-protein kinase PrkC [Eubacterium sulci ATCC 35585]MBF1136370.1 Stk1 family PASTA domain-containing Ser/Thr kinase [[Eubacterium] sulci]MBF1137419.1 Stk1 family PASTA domain-containing Ser/Thr kinase [[Eubacterium] sulci]MBF1153646.1 Stk1 family PASTA domain-containing Ser/Thr kinase [[Eubacterium] sulci]MBF1169850.1 Stk1 family PASTA domain-containing Ser/Thr kinase [[Eubacterium] sulci]